MKEFFDALRRKKEGTQAEILKGFPGGAPEGTEHTYKNGDIYVKKQGSWVPKSKGKGKKGEEEPGSGPTPEKGQVDKHAIAQLTHMKQYIEADPAKAYEIFQKLTPEAQHLVPQNVVTKMVQAAHEAEEKPDPEKVEFEKLGQDVKKKELDNKNTAADQKTKELASKGKAKPKTTEAEKRKRWGRDPKLTSKKEGPPTKPSVKENKFNEAVYNKAVEKKDKKAAGEQLMKLSDKQLQSKFDHHYQMAAFASGHTPIVNMIGEIQKRREEVNKIKAGLGDNVNEEVKNKKNIDEFLNDFILDDIDYDDMKSERDIQKYAEEVAVANLEEYGVKSIKDLSPQQKKKIDDMVKGEWDTVQNIAADLEDAAGKDATVQAIQRALEDGDDIDDVIRNFTNDEEVSEDVINQIFEGDSIDLEVTGLEDTGAAIHSVGDKLYLANLDGDFFAEISLNNKDIKKDATGKGENVEVINELKEEFGDDHIDSLIEGFGEEHVEHMSDFLYEAQNDGSFSRYARDEQALHMGFEEYLEKNNKDVKKAIDSINLTEASIILKGGKSLPIGTKRKHGGVDVEKTAKGWVSVKNNKYHVEAPSTVDKVKMRADLKKQVESHTNGMSASHIKQSEDEWQQKRQKIDSNDETKADEREKIRMMHSLYYQARVRAEKSPKAKANAKGKIDSTTSQTEHALKQLTDSGQGDSDHAKALKAKLERLSSEKAAKQEKNKEKYQKIKDKKRLPQLAKEMGNLEDEVYDAQNALE